MSSSRFWVSNYRNSFLFDEIKCVQLQIYGFVTGTQITLFCSSSTADLICVQICVIFTPAWMTAKNAKFHRFLVYSNF